MRPRASEPMKRLFIVSCMLLALTACRTSAYTSDGSVSGAASDHSHAAVEGDNVVAHDPVGYCGNTVTTVRCTAGEGWEKSFWGGTSVELTDFLRWLDLSGEVCRCLPEYYVKTEFGASEYGIDLSEGYVRFEGKQTQLTREQVERLQTMMEDIAAGKLSELCSLPLAE